MGNSEFDGLVDEYVAEALAATGSAPLEQEEIRPALIEPLPRRGAARGSIEVRYGEGSIQALLDETLDELNESADTNLDIPACPVIRRI